MSKDLFFEMRQQELAQILDDVENGEQSALVAFAHMKYLSGLYDEAAKQIEDIALSEASTYPENTFQKGNFVFTKRTGATRYSYNHLLEWKLQNEGLKKIEEKYKQAFISAQKGLLVADFDGEILEMPKVSYSKDGISVKTATH